MDRVIDLISVVKREVESYERPAIKATTFAFSDDERQRYAVLIVAEPPPKFDAGIMVMARIVGNYVVIDEDTTDRPLWEELVRAGIPRDQIILTYAGEKLPEAS